MKITRGMTTSWTHSSYFLWYIPGLWTCFEFYSVRSSFCPFDGLVGARRYFSSFFHYFKQLCLFEKLKEVERGVGGSVCVSMWVSLCANSRAHPALQKKQNPHEFKPDEFRILMGWSSLDEVILFSLLNHNFAASLNCYDQRRCK